MKQLKVGQENHRIERIKAPFRERTGIAARDRGVPGSFLKGNKMGGEAE
ncbi:MAG: hypothetical protein JWO30_842 [Fibrobacteres bacterium]|nr:hypothetical protein [Fibrobacterota bacterium]